MLTWITGQSIVVIAAIVFGAVYLLAALVLAMVALAARRGVDRAFKGVRGVALDPVSVIFALLVGFLGADVWPAFDRAGAALGVEASRLRGGGSARRRPAAHRSRNVAAPGRRAYRLDRHARVARDGGADADAERSTQGLGAGRSAVDRLGRRRRAIGSMTGRSVAAGFH
jgi:hypothetical protein